MHLNFNAYIDIFTSCPYSLQGFMELYSEVSWSSVLYLTNRQKSKFIGWFKIAGEIKELVFPVNM